ncbi:MAG: DUF4168 domain-containing protein [Gammaproteobacteria bacterium]|nr:MAG: DUF4168 domain-containing protein [Gammaproteobacteria bacterium]
MQPLKHLIRRSVITALAASPLAVAPVALAAQYDEPQQGGAAQGFGGEQHAESYDDATLENFADAFVEVQSIQTSASQEMEQAGDPAEAQDIQQRAQEEMVQAVIDTGLTVETYNRIAQQMNTDIDLREDVMARLEDRMGG